jgi:hypothetical protein
MSSENDENGLGTVYITSVSGPKQYTLDTKQMKEFSKQGYALDQSAENTQFFQVISIDKNKLTYIAYNALGEQYDRAVIIKDFKTGVKSLTSKTNHEKP